MTRSSMRIAVLALALAPSLSGQCSIQLRDTLLTYTTHGIGWNAVPGSARYVVEESPNDFTTIHVRTVTGTSANFTHIANVPKTYSYRVTAQNPNDPTFVPCTSQVLRVTFTPDPDFLRATRRLVIPIVGKVAGANGAQFRTSLRLTSTRPLRGKLVLRPHGRPGTDADPAIDYEVDGVLEIPDLMAAFGVSSGLGSLDIVPDITTSSADFILAPAAEARLFNEAANGTFGTFSPALRPGDFVDTIFYRVKVPHGPFRMNIGFRCMVHSRVVVRVEGDPARFRQFTTHEGELVFGRPEDVLGFSVAPGETLEIVTGLGLVIPFYTLTDNTTNDPSVHVPAAIDTNLVTEASRW